MAVFDSVEDAKNAINTLHNISKAVGAARVATNPTPLGIAAILANQVSESMTDKSIPEHVMNYLRKNIRPATGTNNVGPGKSGAVLSEGGFFRDPTQLGATDMGAGQYAEGGEVEQDPEFLAALKRQRLREQAFDNEFAIEVAAQSNYAADIDPSIARYHGFDYVPGNVGINYQGFYVDPEKTDLPIGAFEEPITGFIKGRYGELPAEVGTINAVHNKATPLVYAHEYRHKQFPDITELQNRLVDGLTALNESQWEAAVYGWQDMSRRQGKNVTPSQAQKDLINKLKKIRGFPFFSEIAQKVIGEEWDREARSTRQGLQDNRADYIQARLDEAFFVKKAKQLKELEKYNEELPEQNEERREEAAVRGYAKGGVASLAPVAKNMFRTPDIRRGIGGFANS